MQSDVNLSPLILLCSRIPLVDGGVYCPPCGGWVLVCHIAKQVFLREKKLEKYDENPK